MLKVLADTRFAVALLALGMVCVTILVALGKVDFATAIKDIAYMLFGAGACWNRGNGGSNAIGG